MEKIKGPQRGPISEDNIQWNKIRTPAGSHVNQRRRVLIYICSENQGMYYFLMNIVILKWPTHFTGSSFTSSLQLNSVRP